MCGADKASFSLEGGVEEKPQAPMPVIHEDLEKLSPGVLAAMCSDLARGCEKQYQAEEAALYQQLTDFFTAAAPAAPQNTLEEKAALQLAEGAETDGLYRLMTALAKSARLVNEDLLRESGYMLPQSKNARDLLEKWVQSPPSPQFPVKAAQNLLERIPCNECDSKEESQIMSQWKCKVCGHIHEGETLPPDFVCPVCRQPASSFEKMEQPAKTNPYAGTQTEKNLAAAFAGESEARNKYTYFSSVAKKEGYEQIAALFLKTAKNEREHAKMWFKELGGLGDTAQNLLHAAQGENYEWTDT